MQQNFIRMIAATILVLICALPAPAAELPSRKPGLWEVKTSIGNSNAPARVIQQCIDAATDQQCAKLGEFDHNRFHLHVWW